jgi:hypothetical protein
MCTFIKNNTRLLSLILLTVALAADDGCRAGPRRAALVDEELARQSLREVLETWKNGGSLEALRQNSPIVAQDMDWRTGSVLLRYEILGEGKNDDANLRCPVKLTLRDQRGREVKKQVTYIIGTDPVITVFREMSL